MCKTIAYLRVSTENQEIEAQKTEINAYASFHRMTIDQYIEVEISSRKSEKARGIDDLCKTLKKGDTLIVSELSRLARSIRQIHNIIESLLSKGVTVHIIKQGLIARDNDLTTKITINAFAMAAEIERDLISQRTKNGLALARQRGKVLGNPNLKADNAKRIERADTFADSLEGIISGLVNQGKTQRQIVEELNKANVKTARGKEWQLISLQRVLKRINLNTHKASA